MVSRALWSFACTLVIACNPPPLSDEETPDASEDVSVEEDTPRTEDTAPPDCPEGQPGQKTCLPDEPDLGAITDCPTQTLTDEGLCALAPPQLTSEACPSALLSPEGVCMPAPPALVDWACPVGWTPTEAFESHKVCTPPTEPAWIGDCPPEGQLWHDEATLRDRAPGFDGQLHHAQPEDLVAILAQAEAGDIVALAAGNYPNSEISPSINLALIGACAASTRVEGSPSNEGAATVNLGASGGLIRDLTISGLRQGIAVSGPEAPIQIERVRVHQAVRVGVEINGGTQDVELVDLLIQDTHGRRDNLSGGVGLRVKQGAQVEALRLVVRESRYRGVVASGDSTRLDLVDSHVEGTLPQDSNSLDGHGLLIKDGARCNLTRTSLTANTHRGLLAEGTGTEAHLEGVLVADTVGSPILGPLDHGVGVLDGAQLSGEGLLVLRNPNFGVEVSGRGSTVTASDMVVSDTQARANGDAGWGMAIAGQVQVNVERIAVVGNRGWGIAALHPDAEVTIRDVRVADTRPQQSDGGSGIGIGAGLGARMVLERALVVRNHTLGLFLGGSEVGRTTHKISDIQVIETAPQAADMALGIGLAVSSRADVEADRVVLLRNTFAGLRVTDPGTRLTLSDALIADTQLIETTNGRGWGLQALEGTEVVVRRAIVSRNHTIGVLFLGQGASGVLSDIRISDTLPHPGEDLGGWGLAVHRGASVEVERAALEGNRAIGVSVRGASSATLSQILVTDTLPQTRDDRGGMGMELTDGPQVDISQAVLLRNRSFGLVADAPGTTVRMEDLRILGTLPRVSDQEVGAGLWFQKGALGQIERVELRDNHLIGLFAGAEGTQVSGQDLIVLDTQPQLSDQDRGVGLQMQQGAVVEIERARFEGNHQFGVVVMQGAHLNLREALISGTLPSPNGLGGSGLAVLDASAHLSRFLAHQNDLAGIQVISTRAFLAETGLITDNLVGVNIQSESFDLETGFVDVEVYDNGVDLDAQELPVPSASEAFDVLDDPGLD